MAGEMIRLRKLTAFLFVLPCMSIAHAGLIDASDSTIDTETGFEWLDLTLTRELSYDSVIGGYGGYIASGYRYATFTEVCELFGALGDQQRWRRKSILERSDQASTLICLQ